MRKYEQMKRLYSSIMNYLNPLDCSELYVAAITSDFDRLFELSWKTLKEYMQIDLGIQKARTGSPKEILGLACQQLLLHDSKMWYDMHRDRNDDAHVYNLLVAYDYKNKIERVYLQAINELIQDLQDLIPSEDGQLPVKPPVSFTLHVLSSNLKMEDAINTYCNRFDVEVQELYDNWDSKYSKLVTKNKDVISF